MREVDSVKAARVVAGVRVSFTRRQADWNLLDKLDKLAFSLADYYMDCTVNFNRRQFLRDCGVSES